MYIHCIYYAVIKLDKQRKDCYIIRENRSTVLYIIYGALYFNKQIKYGKGLINAAVILKLRKLKFRKN